MHAFYALNSGRNSGAEKRPPALTAWAAVIVESPGTNAKGEIPSVSSAAAGYVTGYRFRWGQKLGLRFDEMVIEQIATVSNGYPHPS